MRDFGQYLKTVRKAVMTQRSLAQKVGVGFPYISKLENNVEPPPSDEVLLKLSKELNVDMDEMFANAGRIPIDLKKFLVEKPESIKLLRLIQQEDATSFLLNHFERIVKEKESANTNSFDENENIILLIDPKTSEIINANAMAVKFYKYPIEELKKIKMTDINILPKEDILEEMNKARLEFKNHFYFKHKLKDGEIKEVKVHSNPVIIGGKIYLKSIAYDISKLPI